MAPSEPRRLSIVLLLVTLATQGCATTPPSSVPDPYQAMFISMANGFVDELDKPFSEFSTVAVVDTSASTHHQPFFLDAYAVRDLCFAYDETGNSKYLDAARKWADQMVVYQETMSPAGADDMNYFRKPGDTTGDRYTADASTIAIAVLEVAQRTKDFKYLSSVLSYANLIERSYVNTDGGVTDGVWGTYSASWWCSTVNYGNLMLMLYQQTGDPIFLQRASRELDWVAKVELDNFAYPSMKTGPEAIVFYTGLFVSAARDAGLNMNLIDPLIWLAVPKSNRKPKQPGGLHDQT